MPIERRRGAQVERRTAETEVRVAIDLDGRGRVRAETGIPFFNHLLEAFGHHGLFDLEVEARGDLEVDAHHTVEDVGIVLGQALARAGGDRAGIVRFGEATLPMDDALVQCALDWCGRPFLACRLDPPPRLFGLFHSELAEEFWRAVAMHAGLTLHLRQLAGHNAHHILEAAWKAAGRALLAASRLEPRREGAPSTKGTIA